jgi:hypothetical protein
MAQAAGLELMRYRRHDHPPNRNNYLLRKPDCALGTHEIFPAKNPPVRSGGFSDGWLFFG